MNSWLSNWEKQGEELFFLDVKRKLSQSNQLFSADGLLQDIRYNMYQLIHLTCFGKIKIRLLIKSLRRLVGVHEGFTSLLLDILSVLDVEYSASNNSSARHMLFDIINALTEFIPVHLIMERLDIESFSLLSSVKNPKSFTSKFIKLKTKLYYKQRKYNLLREENEGYSKLMVELIQASISYSESTESLESVESVESLEEEAVVSADMATEPENSEVTRALRSRVQLTLQVVKSIIGCFNLDPNRVLDVMLCVLESFTLGHTAALFTVTLTRAYVTGNAAAIVGILGARYKQLHDRPHTAPYLLDLALDASLVERVCAARCGAASAGTVNSPPDGARDVSMTDDCADVSADPVCALGEECADDGLAEVLALHRLTALLLKYHVIALEDVWPMLSPSDNCLIEVHKRRLIAARKYQNRNSVISTKEKTEASAEMDIFEPLRWNAKLALIKALIDIGAWDVVEKNLSIYPDYMLMCYAPISHSLCTQINLLIDPIYNRYCSKMFLHPHLADKSHQNLDDSQDRSRLASSDKHSSSSSPSSHIVLFEDLTDTSKQRDLQTFRLSVLPLLHALGVYVYQDVALMYKILRVSSAIHKLRLKYAENSSENQNDIRRDFLYYDILSIMEECILPALLMIESNCCLSEEIWSAMQYYSYQHRYRLYGFWKNEVQKNQPLIICKRTDHYKQAKSLMKRLSKENVRTMGRSIGKLTHSAPAYLFDYMLGQIQIYDNLIQPVVDALRFLTNFSYDVLSYCIIEALSNPEKDRTKHDGTSISLWLNSLSNFCGYIFKKYNLELSGVLQFVANQLKSMKSLDLLVLREIVQKMTGVEALEGMTEDQLEAMGGGEILRSEGGFLNQIRNTKKSSQRLRDALIDNDLVVSIFILMAQQRHCVVFKETENSHLKLVGILYDQCHDTMVQYGLFMSAIMSTNDFLKHAPPIDEMLSDFNISADVVFFFMRSMLMSKIHARYETTKHGERSRLTPEQKRVHYSQACDHVIQQTTQALLPIYPARVWEDLNPIFFTCFWTLNWHDIHVSTEAYASEIKRLKAQLTQLQTDTQRSAKKECERHQALIEKLEDEQHKQREHVHAIHAYLRAHKDAWFEPRGGATNGRPNKADTMTQLVQLCLFPRCIFTAMDALYCAQFVLTLHQLKTPNFSTLICYDRLFCNITMTFACCTEHEASRYGRFLSALLATILRWHSSAQIFEAECAYYPGFVTKFRVSNRQNDRSDHVDYENFRHVCFKWFYKITKALVTCLDSRDYIQIRNALTVLRRTIDVYPILSHVATIIERKTDVVIQSEKGKRQDLYILATSYMGLLRSKRATYIGEKQFHIVDKNRRPLSTASENSSADQKSINSLSVNTTINEKSSASVQEIDVDVISLNVLNKQQLNRSDNDESDILSSQKRTLSESNMLPKKLCQSQDTNEITVIDGDGHAPGEHSSDSRADFLASDPVPVSLFMSDLNSVSADESNGDDDCSVELIPDDKLSASEDSQSNRKRRKRDDRGYTSEMNNFNSSSRRSERREKRKNLPVSNDCSNESRRRSEDDKFSSARRSHSSSEEVSLRSSRERHRQLMNIDGETYEEVSYISEVGGYSIDSSYNSDRSLRSKHRGRLNSHDNRYN